MLIEDTKNCVRPFPSPLLIQGYFEIKNTHRP